MKLIIKELKHLKGPWWVRAIIYFINLVYKIRMSSEPFFHVPKSWGIYRVYHDNYQQFGQLIAVGSNYREAKIEKTRIYQKVNLGWLTEEEVRQLGRYIQAPEWYCKIKL